MGRCFITPDHPNAGPFTRYPRIYSWLMSQKYREETIESFKHSAKVVSATEIAGLDRELSLYEIAQMTRSGPAKALGLGRNTLTRKLGAAGRKPRGKHR